MKTASTIKFILYFGTGLLYLSCTQKPAHFDHYLCHVTIVDVKNGTLVPDQNVGITGQKIVSISARETTVDGLTNVIDGKGKFLIPGLWDMHAHYYWNADVSNHLLIANGVTGIREMFGDMKSINAIRSAAKRNQVFAPEIVSSGPIIDGYPAVWPGSDTITAASCSEALVRKQIKEGVDFLKVYSLLNRESYLALAAAAKKSKIPFAGHVPVDISIWEAIQNGQKSIEHFDGLLEGCMKHPETLNQFKNRKDWLNTKKQETVLTDFDETILDSLVKTLAKSNTWLCPTLTVLRSISCIKDTAFTNDARLKFLPAWMYGNWSQSWQRDSLYFIMAKKQFSFQKSLMGRLQKGGVKLLAGTDFPNPYCFPGFSLHDELTLLVEGGLTPAEALRAATLNAAVYLQKEKEYGSIKTGSLASLVLLDKNPLSDINNTRSIAAVFLKGRYFNRQALDHLPEKK